MQVGDRFLKGRQRGRCAAGIALGCLWALLGPAAAAEYWRLRGTQIQIGVADFSTPAKPATASGHD
jgi:hypothetical protein